MVGLFSCHQQRTILIEQFVYDGYKSQKNVLKNCIVCIDTLKSEQ